MRMKKCIKKKRQYESNTERKICRKNHLKLADRKTNKIIELWYIDLISSIKQYHMVERHVSLQ